MIYLTINPNETPETYQCFYGGAKIYHFIEIENKVILCYKVGGYTFDSIGTYMNDSNYNMVLVTCTDGNEVTEWFRQTYPSQHLNPTDVVYESTVVFPDTTITGYHVTRISEYSRDRFLSNYDSQYEYFRYDRNMYVVTEDDAVYGGDYVCEEATIEITGTSDYEDYLYDTNGNQWSLFTVSESEANSVPTTKDEYFYRELEWKKVGDGLYQCDYENHYIGTFKEGEYIFTLYNSAAGDYNYKYYPCSYAEKITTPVTVITSAGTPTAITGTEVIVNIDGNILHGLVYDTGTWYGGTHFYTGSTFDDMVFAMKGSFYAEDFRIFFVKGNQGGNVFEGITPGVAYSEASDTVYYNGGLLLKRLNDGCALHIFSDKTIEFNRGFEAWFKKHFDLHNLGDYIIEVSPEDVDSIIINGIEYKQTLDADPTNWIINLVHGASLYNRNSGEYISPDDGKVTVTFSDEFMAKGKLYVFYGSHSS